MELVDRLQSPPQIVNEGLTRARQGQKTPKDLDKIAATFAVKVKRTMQELGVTKVYNTDQTGKLYCLKLLCLPSNILLLCCSRFLRIFAN